MGNTVPLPIYTEDLDLVYCGMHRLGLCITYLHGKVGDESCSWDLHLKHGLPCLGAAVHHGAGHGGEGIPGNDRGPHVELRHPRPGFLWESKNHP